MKIYDAILTRRTIKDFKPQPVPGDVLDRALSAGIWAQNHKLTEPWRFTVLGPQTHAALASIDGKLATKPAIVAVTYRLSPDLSQRHEDYAAVCCAIQNIQLAAWADGLGMQWSTGRTAMSPQAHALLGLSATEEEMVGLLYFGYPASVPKPQARKPLAEVTRWLA